jgi:plasmid stability protein
MPSLTIKDIPEDLYRRLKERARQHRRSLNSEAIECLQQILRCVPRDPEEILARVRELRGKSASHVLTDKDLSDMKRNGRP